MIQYSLLKYMKETRTLLKLTNHDFVLILSNLNGICNYGVNSRNLRRYLLHFHAHRNLLGRRLGNGSRLVQVNRNGKIDHRQVERQGELHVEHERRDDGGDHQRSRRRKRLHHRGDVLENGASDESHVHVANDRQHGEEVEVVEGDLLDDCTAILDEEEEEVNDSSPTRDDVERSERQIKPDALLENGHVAVRLHQLLNRHSRSCHNSSAYNRQHRRVHRKVGKGGGRRTGQLNRGDGVAHQNHCCPVDPRETA